MNYYGDYPVKVDEDGVEYLFETLEEAFAAGFYDHTVNPDGTPVTLEQLQLYREASLAGKLN